MINYGNDCYNRVLPLLHGVCNIMLFNLSHKHRYIFNFVMAYAFLFNFYLTYFTYLFILFINSFLETTFLTFTSFVLKYLLHYSF